MARIEDGTGSQQQAKVTQDSRVATDAITETISSERSRQGKLYGTGTGSISLTGSESLAPVLWLQNTGTDFMFIHKLIFGWNGGDTNHDRTVLSFIKYKTTQPTTNTADASPAIENISLSGASAAVTDSNATGLKWDGVGSSGMTGGSGGYLQIPNRLSIGDTEKSINGEIILGANDSMEIEVTPEEAGLFHVSIVYYRAPKGGRVEVQDFI